MDVKVIERLLTSAELCFERGQYKMANRAMDEIEERVGDQDMGPGLTDRFNYLCNAIPELETDRAQEGQFCSSCNGSGRYYNRKCVRCAGKGYQTEADVTRNRIYWEYRQLREQGHQPSS